MLSSLPFTIPNPPLLLLFHLLLSLSLLLLSHLLHLPSLLLFSLHTYIHPDHLPSTPRPPSALRPAIRPPNQQQQQPHSKSKFDESQAQLLRLRLSHPLLLSRPSFLPFHLSLLLPFSSLPLLFFSPPSPLPLLTLFPLLLSLLLLTKSKSSISSSSHHQSRSIFLAIIFSLPVSLLLLSHLFHLPSQLSLLASLLSPALLPSPSLLARSFWLATDQLRSHLSIISSPYRPLLYLSALSTSLSPLLFFHQHLKTLPLLAAAAILQLLVLRPNLQMYLNEAVLCWYQRLHSARKPDLEYGRTKVFLHNHYVCAVATQLAAPPAMVLVLLGVARMSGNLFTGVLFLDGIYADDWSDGVKECALFLAWWVVFVQAVVMMSCLALYRTGFMFVS